MNNGTFLFKQAEAVIKVAASTLILHAHKITYRGTVIHLFLLGCLRILAFKLKLKKKEGGGSWSPNPKRKIRTTPRLD